MTEATRVELGRLPSLLAAYGRALLTRKPGLRGGSTVPRIEVRLRGHLIDPRKLERYRQVCGFADASAVPITYPQVIANALHATLVSSDDFPLDSRTIVHRGCAIVARRALDPEARLDLLAAVEGHREVHAGLEVDFETTVACRGEPVWRSTSTVLFRDRKKTSKPRQRQAAAPGDRPDRERTTIWRLPANAGRAYAAAAGDYNPIHLWAVTAKLFGFERAIIHGMWSFARCLAELAGDLPPYPLRVEARFKRPVFLPGDILFRSGVVGDTVEFALHSADGSAPHLVGSANPAA